MKIIDSKKDYYDYLQGIKGIDPLVTYDRRNSKSVGESEFYDFTFPHDYDLYFCRKPFKCDSYKVKKKAYGSSKYENRTNRRIWGWKAYRGKDDVYEGSIYNLRLEVGYNVLIFEIERYLDDEDKLHVDVSLVENKKISKDKKKSKAPIYLSTFYGGYYGEETNNQGIENPILKNTWIPGLVSAEDMWNMIYEYISSLNDKEFIDSRTNEQHIESHGFDKKISFRHRK